MKKIVLFIGIVMILIVGCNKPINKLEDVKIEVKVEETNFPCVEGRECIDICNGTLLVMQQGECDLGCVTYQGKLVGRYELQFALERCK